MVRLLMAAFALVALGTVLAVFAPVGWPFELFSHFRAQYAAAALLIALLLVIGRRSAYAAAALVLAVWNGLPIAQRALADPPSACEGPEFTVVTANLQHANQSWAPFLEWLDRQPADLVVVQELTPGWARILGGLPDYTYRELRPRADAYGVGVLSRWPLESVATVDLAGDGLPALTGLAVVDGRPVRFLGMHARWPMTPWLARDRDAALAGAARLVRDDPRPVVVLGDLNLSPDAPAFARLLRDAGLHDVMRGPDWRPTWQADFWPLALRIDHVLVSGDLCVERADVGAAIGSDHRPVAARLRVSSAPDPIGPARSRAGS